MERAASRTRDSRRPGRTSNNAPHVAPESRLPPLCVGECDAACCIGPVPGLARAPCQDRPQGPPVNQVVADCQLGRVALGIVLE